MTATREDVIAEATQWVGTPFHDRAGVKGHGTDCLHLVVRVYQAVGLLEKFDPPVYSPQWFQHRQEPLFLDGIAKHAHQVEVAQPGDIAMLNLGRHAAHAAIIVDHYTMIHAWKPAGGVIRDSRAAYADRLHSFWSMFP